MKTLIKKGNFITTYLKGNEIVTDYELNDKFNKPYINYSKIDNIEIDGIDYSDYPDFCDAFIASADYDGKPMTDEMLDLLNEDTDFVYEQVQNYLF